MGLLNEVYRDHTMCLLQQVQLKHKYGKMHLPSLSQFQIPCVHPEYHHPSLSFRIYPQRRQHESRLFLYRNPCQSRDILEDDWKSRMLSTQCFRCLKGQRFDTESTGLRKGSSSPYGFSSIGTICTCSSKNCIKCG